jgi:PleD family two-component response regulator
MHSIIYGKQAREPTKRELFLCPLSVLPPQLPSRKSISHHEFSSDPNIEEQLRKYDLTANGAETAGAANSDELNNPPISSSTGPKRILIVDDDHDIALFYKMALERVGFVVDVFSDPLKAFSSYRTGVYDLLLLDVRMPQMSGFELYSKIKTIDDKVKVCFITAFEDYHNEFKNIFTHRGESECYIKKPVTMQELIRLVRSRLEPGNEIPTNKDDPIL